MGIVEAEVDTDSEVPAGANLEQPAYKSDAPWCIGDAKRFELLIIKY